MAAGYNDNLRSQSASRISSPFLALMPDVSATRTDGEDQYQVGLRSEWTRFTRSHEDDTLNTELSASGVNVIDPRTAAAWRLGLQDWHDALGQTDPNAPATSPDHFRAEALGAVLRHDAGTEGRWRVELEPTLSHKRYLNHRDLTRLADADTLSVVVREQYQHDAARRSGLELRAIRTQYPSDLTGITNTAMRAHLTYQSDPQPDVPLSGNLGVGGERRDFASFRPAYTGYTWDAGAQWQPRAGTLASIATTRGASEAPGQGVDEIVARRVTLSLTQEGPAHWVASVSASTGHDHYVGSDVARDDDVRAIDLAVRHDLGRRWQLAVNLGWLHRQSELAAFDFTRRLASVVLTGAL